MECLCGCGLETNVGKQYLRGHWAKANKTRKPHTQETRLKLSEYWAGKPRPHKGGYKLSTEARKNQSIGKILYFSTRPGNGTGRKHTEKQKENNIRIAKLYLDKGPGPACLAARAAIGWKRGKDHPRYGKQPPIKKVLVEEHNIWVRSTYEARFIRYCDALQIKWEYEPQYFELTNPNCTYLPDFYLKEYKLWVEIKGYWYKDAREKFTAFGEQYPKLWILPINGTTLRQLERRTEILPKKRNSQRAKRILESGMGVT